MCRALWWDLWQPNNPPQWGPSRLLSPKNGTCLSSPLDCRSLGIRRSPSNHGRDHSDVVVLWKAKHLRYVAGWRFVLFSCLLQGKISAQRLGWFRRWCKAAAYSVGDWGCLDRREAVVHWAVSCLCGPLSLECYVPPIDFCLHSIPPLPLPSGPDVSVCFPLSCFWTSLLGCLLTAMCAHWENTKNTEFLLL